jgi:hypothetical protein
MTFVDPGAISECDARTQEGSRAGSWHFGGRVSVPLSAAVRHSAYFAGASK